jgi:hypothetical protein
MAARCPTCNQQVHTVGDRLVGELTTLALTVAPLTVAILLGRVPLWLTIWGCAGLALVLFSWLYYAVRRSATAPVSAPSRTTTARITDVRRSPDRL